MHGHCVSATRRGSRLYIDGASRLVCQSFARMRGTCQACYSQDDENRDCPHSPSARSRAHRTAATLHVPYHPSLASRCRPLSLSLRTSSRTQLCFPWQGNFDCPGCGTWRMPAPGFSRGYQIAPAVAWATHAV